VWRGQQRRSAPWPDVVVPGGPGSTGYVPRVTPPTPTVANSSPPRRRDAAPPPPPLVERARRKEAVPEPSAPWQPVLAWTIALFTVPMLAYLAWAWTRSGTADSCINVADGTCVAPRTAALAGFVDAFPGVIAATALSVAISAGLRRLDYAWRPVTIALGGSVIGAGVVTIVLLTFR